MHVSLDTDSAKAREFLDKLANDDDFRRELQANPEEVLREYGVEIDGIDDREIELPPKELVQQVHGQALTAAAPGGGTRPWFGPAGVGLLAVAAAITD